MLDNAALRDGEQHSGSTCRLMELKTPQNDWTTINTPNFCSQQPCMLPCYAPILPSLVTGWKYRKSCFCTVVETMEIRIPTGEGKRIQQFRRFISILKDLKLEVIRRA